MGREKVGLRELRWAAMTDSQLVDAREGMRGEWKETTKAKSWAAATAGDSACKRAAGWAQLTAKSVAAGLDDQRAAARDDSRAAE